MKMKRTSIFIFSLLLSLSGFSQEVKDSIPVKTERYGLRVGADIYRLARSFYDDNYQGFELVGDYRLTRKFYLAAELGNEKKRSDEDQLDFTTKGSYFKV